MSKSDWIWFGAGLLVVAAVVAFGCSALHLGAVISAEAGCLAGMIYTGVFFGRLK